MSKVHKLHLCLILVLAAAEPTDVENR